MEVDFIERLKVNHGFELGRNVGITKLKLLEMVATCKIDNLN